MNTKKKVKWQKVNVKSAESLRDAYSFTAEGGCATGTVHLSKIRERK